MKIIHRICLLMLFVVTSAGCALTSTQREAASRLAQASSDIGDFSSNEFNHFRRATIDMNVTRIAIQRDAIILDDKDNLNLDESLKPDAVIERVKSAQALSSYGKLLLSLVNETQEAELKQASNNFVDSFKSVSKKNMTNSQLEGLGQLVQAIGSIVVEAKKADAVKAIVPAAAKDVEQLCDLLIKDFSAITLNVGQGFDATISDLIGKAALALKDTNTSYTDRLIASNGIKKAWEEREHLTNISNQAIETLKKLKAANSQLKQALEDDSLSVADIKTVGQEVNSLKTAVTALSSDK